LSPGVEAAASTLRRASRLLVAAGAGMGVDSGLPDFRGPEGFWRAYPPFKKLGLGFVQLANPRWFEEDPELAWGFYGHRQRLYRATPPHAGFAVLRRWASRMGEGAFVFTSNVDGHFQRAGFPEGQVWEVHGSIHFSQCLRECGVGLFPAGPDDVEVDESTMRARPPLPSCPACGGLARPNILMFGDWGFDERRSAGQSEGFRRWLAAGKGPLAIVECGAGEAVPTIRRNCEALAREEGASLVRINLRESEVPEGQVGIAAGAREALEAIDLALG
jgi:NAD-dependent SIR2 family protein deacetylase